MRAAKTSSSEAVKILLSKGADPNLVYKYQDSDGPKERRIIDEDIPALAFAFETGNIEVINLLCKVTSVGLDACIPKLAQTFILNTSDSNENQDTISDDIESFIRKLRDDSCSKIKQLFERASFYGNSSILHHILKEYRSVITDQDLFVALQNIVYSDNVEAFQTILKFPHGLEHENLKSIARERGNISIIQLLDMEVTSQSSMEILEKIPKSEEFSYVNVMEKITKFIKEKRKTSSKSSKKVLVNFDELLKRFQAKVCAILR